MFRHRPLLSTSVLALLVSSMPTLAFAQNWSFDARTIALGGVGSGTGNIAAGLIDEQKPYRAIVLPFGLLQVLRDFGRFDPGGDGFDPVRAAEYAASPLHYVVGRDGNSSPNDFFIMDILNGELSRDLNAYKGYVPASELAAEGLANPVWGKTFRFAERDGAFHGVFAGAGPYLSMRTSAIVDERLRTVLNDDVVPTYYPNDRIDVSADTIAQMAMAITGGYRARIPVAGFRGPRDGVYLAANYNYLKGFRYESIDTALRLDTDAAGLLTVNRLLPSPLRVTRNSSDDGRGFAIDVGAGIVLDRWQFGFGANGIANRIEWTGVEPTLYSLDTLFSGDGDFDDVELPLVPGDVRVELPVDYRGHVGYDRGHWGATAEWSNGFQGTVFRAGVEKKFGAIELRGGGRYVRDRWEPAGGAGFNLTDRVGVDVAAFATSANVERERRAALAVSLRIMRGN